MKFKTIKFFTGFVAFASLVGFAATRVATAGSAGTAVAVAASSNVLSLETHQCSYCHTIHGGSGGPRLINAADSEILCLTCHGAGGTASLVEVHREKLRRSDFDPFWVTCVGCHNPHSSMINWLGGQNIGLIGADAEGTGIASVISPTGQGVRYVVVESRGTSQGQPSLHSFADGDEDGNGVYDGICETCHTLTGHHRNDDSPGGDHTHNVGKTCTQCHNHDNYFHK